MILEDAGLNKDGDPIPDREVPKRKDRKKVSKGNLDDEKDQKKKNKMKGADQDSAEEELAEQEKKKANEEARAKKKAAKKAEAQVSKEEPKEVLFDLHGYKLNEAEYEKIKLGFVELDNNGDGFITRDEY